MTSNGLPDARGTIAEYYRAPAVRQRIREYCGASGRAPVTAVFLAGMTAGAQVDWNHAPRFPPGDLDRLMRAGADLSRSMWDRRDLLVHLDIDYQNVDRPGEAFEHPGDAFLKMEPTRRAVQDLLDAFDLPLMAIMTGRGYHFTGRVGLASPLVASLAALVPTPSWIATCSERRPPWARATVTPKLARAYTGLGLLIEYFAHLVIQSAVPHSHLPVVVNGTVVGPDPWGRECVSLDFTYAGDPLDIRHLRVAFGAYQMHRFRPDVMGPAASTSPPLIAVPLASRSVMDVLQTGREPEAAADIAAHASAEIPIVADGIGRLLDAYRASALFRFHQDFYAAGPPPPSSWPEASDHLDLHALVPCVRSAIAAPNDLLLKPEHVQHVTRYLLSRGWHPRRIACLVHSRYAKDFGWGNRWTRMDAQTRAEFDVRVFAGMVATGLDQGIDFNCRSAQEKGLCPGEACTHDLRSDRDRLLARGM